MNLALQVRSQISTIPETDWQRLAGGDPFLSHAFFHALESSKSVGGETGWQPLYLLAYEKSASGDNLVGAAPLWLKTHSFGEYIFDQVFAESYEQHGDEYYPKLLVAVPFSPVNGHRILTADQKISDAMVEGIMQITDDNAFSSAHINFSIDKAPASPWLERHNVQYHFHNDGYHSFDEFLLKLNTSKRKMIRKEREHVKSYGLRIEMKSGRDLSPSDWECFWNCYQETGSRKWGQPYLTRAFFEQLGQSLKDQIIMCLAYEGDHPIASALHLTDERRLLGRYWGSLRDYRFLHLELCYYQAIEYAIAHKIPWIEAGAQGEHKIARGYQPVIIKSYHYVRDLQFREAIARFLRTERNSLAQYVNDVKMNLPFKSI